MNVQELEGKLSLALGGNYAVFETLDSTNSYIRRAEPNGLPDGYVVCALSQSAGRGRHGKSFISPAGGVYLSTIMCPAAAAEECACLTAWAAVAVCSAIEKVCGISPQIKWVNDLVLGSKKICGILSELAFDENGGIKYVIIGVGVNANTPGEYFSGELSGIASSIFEETGIFVDEAALAAEIALQLRNIASSFPENKADILEQYRSRCASLGKEVAVLLPEGEFTAFAENIDESFRLVVRGADGTLRTLLGGEVSVRGLCGYV